MKSPSAIPLLEKWEFFSAQFPGKDMYAFAQWLSKERVEGISVKVSDERKTRSAQVGILITRLQKYLGLYIKPVVNRLGFTREHEYNFLYQISRMNKPSKNDLSKENLVEFSTGRDVIRRLIAKKFVSEKPNIDDGRATILTITTLGTKMLEKSFEEVGRVFTDFMGDLTVAEQDQLIYLLTRLNSFQAVKYDREILSYL
jgi:MarR family transcriptional regulator, lower aerobic nicotinate degradation pathway regulator